MTFTAFITTRHNGEVRIFDGETYATKAELYQALRNADDDTVRIYVLNAVGFEDVTVRVGSEWLDEDRAEISAWKAHEGRVTETVYAVDRAVREMDRKLVEAA